MLSRFRTPLVAALLGIVPYFIFLGSSQTVTVNGAVVQDEQLNFLGIVLAAIGLWMAFSTLRPSAPKDMARKGAGVVAGLICLLQLAASLDLVRPLDLFNPDSDLPPLAYNGLSEGNRNLVASMVERGDIEEVTRDFMNRSAFTLDSAHQHMDYADVCHEGRYRIDYDALVGLFSVLPEAQREEVLDRAESMRRPAPAAEDCSEQRTNYAMGEMVDSIHQQQDMIAILRDGYVALAP